MRKQKQYIEQKPKKVQFNQTSKPNNNINQSQKILSKIPSSPLISYHNKQALIDPKMTSSLTYTSRIHNMKKTNVKKVQIQRVTKNTNLKKQTINLKNILPSNRKQPQLVKNRNYQSQKQLSLNSLSIFSQIMKKSKVQPLQKQRKHFNCSYNPQFYRYFNQKYRNYDPKKQNFVSTSRHRKLVQDFQHHIQFSDSAQIRPIRARSKSQSINKEKRQSCKKGGYVLDMFKQSFDLGMDNKASMRKPYLNRTRSTIHLG